MARWSLGAWHRPKGGRRSNGVGRWVGTWVPWPGCELDGGDAGVAWRSGTLLDVGLAEVCVRAPLERARVDRLAWETRRGRHEKIRICSLSPSRLLRIRRAFLPAGPVIGVTSPRLEPAPATQPACRMSHLACESLPVDARSVLPHGGRAWETPRPSRASRPRRMPRSRWHPHCTTREVRARESRPTIRACHLQRGSRPALLP